MGRFYFKVSGFISKVEFANPPLLMSIIYLHYLHKSQDKKKFFEQKSCLKSEQKSDLQEFPDANAE